MLNEASELLTGDDSPRRFEFVTSMDFSEWPADCTGELEIGLDATFDR